MGPEDIVVEKVVDYFSAPKFERLSTRTEYPVQMGVYKGRADVVLLDSDKKVAAIIECKKIGYEGSGPDQLKGYLCATDTPLGVFANETDPAYWTFYENLGQNQFKQIDRPQFEVQVLKKGIIKTLDNLVRGIFRPRSDRPAPGKPPAPKPIGPPAVGPNHPNIVYTGGNQPLQNDNNADFDPSLNGNPYYSEQNGFYWAANHQGIAECVPQHVKHIISHEELEIKSSREQLQAEIDWLVNEKNELQEQKQDYEQKTEQRVQELARKKEELAGLEAQLQALAPPELNLPSVEEHHQDASTQHFNKGINQLGEDKGELEQEIEQKSQELARKKEELAGLEVELESPTQAELNPISAEVTTKQRFSYSQLITGIIAVFFLIPLVAYLFIFYASVVDKAFFLDVASLKEKSQDILNALDIVNPTALFEAFQRPGNPFVMLFPSIFMAVVMITHAFHDFWTQSKRWWLWSVIAFVLLVTLVFDFILAIHISQKIHEVKKLAGLIPETEQWTFRISDLNMWTVIFCGFVVALFVSILYPATIELWKGVRPRQDESKQLEIQIRSERSSTEKRIATLKAEMENLQNQINQLNEKVESTQQKIDELSRQQQETRIKEVKTPIETQIAVLKAEMENLTKLTNSMSKLRTFNGR